MTKSMLSIREKSILATFARFEANMPRKEPKLVNEDKKKKEIHRLNKLIVDSLIELKPL